MHKKNETGVALLVVLFVLMAITILSLGFLSRSDVELACGKNMVLRTQMDYLAESGLEHARGLIINEINYLSDWAVAEQQLVSGSSDYYNLNVVRIGRCNYQITSGAYRNSGADQIGRSILQAELRLDPCIAYWQQVTQQIPSEVVINGDVYCGDDLANYGQIAGDVYSAQNIENYAGGNITGQKNEFVGQTPISLPGLATDNFSGQYYYNGSGPYFSANIGTGQIEDITLGPTGGNPAGVFYRNGDLILDGSIQITGMLVVTNNLMIGNNAVVTIVAVDNYPALLVGHDLTIEDSNATLMITGLAQIEHCIDMKSQSGSHLDILGALCVLGDGIINTSGCSVNITVAPQKAAIEIWTSTTDSYQWSPIGGALFKNIGRI